MKKIIFPILSAAILLTILSGCVYYNIFYNAKKYYAEALNAKQQNDGKVTPSIDTKLETAIGKCAYIIQEYPTNKWVDNAILLMGQCYYEQGYYIKALRKFNEYEKYYSNQELYPTAKLYLAKTYLAMKEYDEAIKQFSAIFLNQKFTEVRTEAYFDLADYYLEKGQFNNVKSTILDLLNTDLKRKDHLKAMFLYAEIVYTNGEFKSAELAFRNLLAEKPPKRYRLDALMYIGKIYIGIDNYKEALQIFKKLYETEVDYDKLPKIEMYIALCEAHLGNTDTAFKIFETLNEENKGKKIVSLINYYWGDIYFSVLHIDSLAIKKFNAVEVKNVDASIVRDTQNKLKIAQELISFETVQTSNQINKIVEFQFQLAEYYNFDLNKPDSALAMYDDILDRVPMLHQELDTLSVLLLSYPEPDSLELIADSLEIAIDSLMVIDDSVTVTEDSLAISDTLDLELEISHDDSTFIVPDSTEIERAIENSVSGIFPDTTITDSMREISIIDTTFMDSVIVDTMMADSVEMIPEKIMPTRDQILVKIENTQNTINEFETEIIPKVLFMKLWTYKEKFLDMVHADSIYSILEAGYPTSKYTIAGKKLLNNEYYELIEPKEHFAQQYLQKALDYFFDEVTLEQSFAFLDTIISMYDSTEVYPQALYLKSYLYVKESKDTTSARPYLEELFEDYRDHELKNEVSDFFDGKHFLVYEIEEDSVAVIDSTVVMPDSIAISDSLFMIEDSTTVIDSLETMTAPDSILSLPNNENDMGGNGE